MKNQIMRAYANAPASLGLPPLLDYSEILVHVLIGRPDIGWRDGMLDLVSFREYDQPMIGFPGPVPTENRIWGGICLLDREDRIIAVPEEGAIHAQIAQRVDEITPGWFDAAAPWDWAHLKPLSAICKTPFSATAEETFLSYGLLRHLRVAADTIPYAKEYGPCPETVERYLLHCLVFKMEEQGKNLDGLCEHAEAAIAEGKARFPRTR